MPTPIPVLVTELPGNIARVFINGFAFKVQRATIELGTVLSDISNTELGVYGGKMPVQRPVKVTLYQASFDVAFDPFAGPFFMSPLSTQINCRIFPAGIQGPNPYGFTPPGAPPVFPYIFPSMVVGPQSHEIMASGQCLQPLNIVLENLGPWGAPGEIVPELPGTPNFNLV